MADTSAVDVRIRYLEQLAKQLSEQIKIMKQLVTTEVSDLKAVTQQQVAEIKQIVMHQDRVYQERIRRLEARVEQLSEFSMQLARTTGTSGALGAIPLIDTILPAGGSPARGAASPATRDDEADDERIEGVAGIMDKYSQKIDAIYDFYTHSNIQVFHPAMTLAHFTKLCKDCHLCDLQDSGTPPELLWMVVLRKLGKRRLHKAQAKAMVQPVKAPPTTMLTGKHSVGAREKNKASFAHERLEEIPRELFATALSILATEKLGRQRSDLSPEHLFETFLVVDIFPNIDPKMEAARGTELASTLSPRDLSTAAQSVQDYKTPEVRSVMQEYNSRLREAYFAAISKAQPDSYFKEFKVMNLDGFVELVRSHDLLPLISKPDVRQIFLACAAIEAAKNPEAKPDTISIPSFILSIYHLAERIYGDRLFADKYPSPEARARKLLAKMFLLS